MTIHEIVEKFKELISRTDVLLSLLILVVASTSFMLGKYSANTSSQYSNITQQKVDFVNTPEQEKKEVTNIPQSATAIQGDAEVAGYVASRSGTKYHLPWCSGAKRIKEENKVYFATKEEAEKAGYTPASNCKGI